MGNAGSSQPSKVQKNQKKGADNGADRVGKNKRSTNENSGENRAFRPNGKNICHRTTNPFILFFLRLRSKKPKENVTVIARAAGQLWSRMTPEQKKKYIDLANAEKQRRRERRRKRKFGRRLKK